MPSMAAWLGAMAQSTAHASKVHTVEIPSKPGYDQYCTHRESHSLVDWDGERTQPLMPRDGEIKSLARLSAFASASAASMSLNILLLYIAHNGPCSIIWAPSVAGLPHRIFHVTTKLGWEPWRRTSLRSPHSGESDSDGEGSSGNVHGSALNFK